MPPVPVRQRREPGNRGRGAHFFTSLRMHPEMGSCKSEVKEADEDIPIHNISPARCCCRFPR
jgi:hypothetical protein